MHSSPAAWVTTVRTPSICTTCYECGPTPGPCARRRKLRGVHLLFVFSSSIEKDQIQRLCGVQPALCGAYVQCRSPGRPLRRSHGDHGSSYDGTARRAHRGEAYPRYDEHDGQFRHNCYHDLRATAGEVDQGYGTEHKRHKEQVARRKDAEFGPSRWKKKTQKEDERHEAYAAEHKGLVLGRTHSTSYISKACGLSSPKQPAKSAYEALRLASRSRSDSSANGSPRASFFPFLRGRVVNFASPACWSSSSDSSGSIRRSPAARCPSSCRMVNVRTNGGRLPGTKMAAMFNCSE